MRYKDINEQLEKGNTASCARRTVKFIAGLAKRSLANTAEQFSKASAALPVGRHGARSMAGFFYAFQIYFDFRATDGNRAWKIFGFDFPENFNYPYTAESITDFGAGILPFHSGSEIIYIPLGGNRKAARCISIFCGLDADRHLARRGMEFSYGDFTISFCLPRKGVSA